MIEAKNLKLHSSERKNYNEQFHLIDFIVRALIYKQPATGWKRFVLRGKRKDYLKSVPRENAMNFSCNPHDKQHTPVE